MDSKVDSRQLSLTKLVLPQVNIIGERSSTRSPWFSDPAAAEEVESWAQETLKPFPSYRIPSTEVGREYTAYMYPVAPNKETFVLLSQFLTFLFAYADESYHQEETRGDIQRMVLAFEGTCLPVSYNETIMHKLGSKLRHQINEGPFRRIVVGLERWIGSLRQDLNAYGKQMHIEDYLRFREDNSSALLITAIGEAMQNMDSGRFIHKVAVQRAITATANHLLLVKDLYSFRKDYFANNLMSNAVHVLKTNHNMSYQEAIYVCGRLIQRSELEFHQACHEALETSYSSIRDDIQAYVTLLFDCICGNVEYSQCSFLFHGEGCSRVNGGTLVMNPERTIIVY